MTRAEAQRRQDASLLERWEILLPRLALAAGSPRVSEAERAVAIGMIARLAEAAKDGSPPQRLALRLLGDLAEDDETEDPQIGRAV